MSRPASERRTLMLHIGMGKTGTSALQAGLVHNRERLAACGIDYPAHPSDDVARAGGMTAGNGSGLADLLHSELAGAPVDLAHARAGWRSVAAEVARNPLPRILYSSELMYRFRPEHLAALVEATEEAGVDLRIVAYVRDIAPYFVSSYSQRVKYNGFAGSLEDYLGGSEDFERRAELFRPKLRELVEIAGSPRVRVLHYDSVKSDLFAGFARDALDLGDPIDWHRPPNTVNSGLVDPGGRRIGMSRRCLEFLEDRFATDVAWINSEFLAGRMDVQGDVRLIDDASSELMEHQSKVGTPAPRASVVIPTHNHDLTLPITVASVLAQTVTDLEVLIVGDGVTDDLRAMAANLAQSDERIRFFDLPKGEHHGEVHRDLAVRRARSNAIFYLCDDDLFLPRHLENLLPLLENHDLVQCRNGYLTQTGELVLYPTDLADPEAVAWHLQDPPNNCVSITGTAHRRDTYLALDEGWTVTPPGYYPDHHMWRKFLRRDGTRAATHPEMTAIQLPTSDGREELTQQERAAELESWAARLLADPGGHTWLQAELDRVTTVQLDRTYRRWLDAAVLANARTADVEHRECDLRKARHDLRKQQAYAQELHEKFQRLRAAHQEQESSLRRSRRRAARLRQRLRDERASAAAEVAALRASRSWQVTAPLRIAGRLARHLRRR